MSVTTVTSITTVTSVTTVHFLLSNSYISMLCCVSESTPLTRTSQRVKALVQYIYAWMKELSNNGKWYEQPMATICLGQNEICALGFFYSASCSGEAYYNSWVKECEETQWQVQTLETLIKLCRDDNRGDRRRDHFTTDFIWKNCSTIYVPKCMVEGW